MIRRSLQFTAPHRLDVVEELLPEPGPGEVLVRSTASAVSPGTEMLVYRGQWPLGTPVDVSIPSLEGRFAYPLKYGYSVVGEVFALGSGVPTQFLGKTVFAFNPHESHFVARPEHLISVPRGLSPEVAALLPNMETAASFIMDGAPLLGERTLVFGQGIVGLLTTRLLAHFPLSAIVALDNYPLRRQKSLEMGCSFCLDPSDPYVGEMLAELLDMGSLLGGADLTYELSGNPFALDQAVAFTGFDGRIVIGSWYGSKRADLGLGGHFHRARIRLISSQVSRLSPSLTGRWDKSRRMKLALEMLQTISPANLISHRIPFSRASEAYQLLDQSPGEVVQVILAYEEHP